MRLSKSPDMGLSNARRYGRARSAEALVTAPEMDELAQHWRRCVADSVRRLETYDTFAS